MEFETAHNLLQQFKGNSYIYGFDVLKETGKAAFDFGKKAVLVRGTFKGSGNAVETIEKSLAKSH